VSVANYGVDGGSNRLLQITSGAAQRNLSYDAAGNLTQDQRGGVTDCHRYDALGRLAGFER
jgi:YD repeat-containing protein